MEQENRFEFIVDEQYENEKGIFTVLSIHRNEMVIRWESGEELRTDIELQRNIQARREWEKLQKLKEAKAAKSGRKTSAARAAAGFEGFKEKDFKVSASGTKWRGRNQLGGAVTYKLPESNLRFNSWAFANKPEMHWLDMDHQKRKSGDARAKLFVRVDTESMFCGFSIGQPAPEGDKTRNWDNFIHWLGQDENDKKVHAIALTNDLTVYGKDDQASGALTVLEKGWRIGDGKEMERLADYLESLAAQGHTSFEIAKTFAKKDVLKKGKKIVADIVEVFTQLTPLYQASLKPLD